MKHLRRLMDWTKLKMSTTFSALICLSWACKVMNVPVRPTPALQRNTMKCYACTHTTCLYEDVNRKQRTENREPGSSECWPDVSTYTYSLVAAHQYLDSYSACRIRPTRDQLRSELCLWINVHHYPLLQCQSSSGSVVTASDWHCFGPPGWISDLSF